MIKRKIEAELERFYKSSGKYALLIDGARQVGKTYIVERFAAKHYDVFIKVDFVTMKGAKAIFEDVEDEKDVLLRISAFTSKGIKRGKTLEYEIETAIVFNDDTLTVKDNVYYAPVYMSMFLAPPPLPDKMIYGQLLARTPRNAHFSGLTAS
jgi:cold shock CspA family protein